MKYDVTTSHMFTQHWIIDAKDKDQAAEKVANGKIKFDKTSRKFVSDKLTTFTIQDNGFEYFDYALFPRGMSNDAMLKEMFEPADDNEDRTFKIYKLQEVTKETEDVLRDLHIAF